MAIMTSADILKVNNSEELVGVIYEVIKTIPELGFFGASPVQRNTYKTLCVSGLPTAGFRTPGSARTWSTATLGNKTVECKYLDASWILECAVATQSDWGKEVAIAIQQKTHLKAAFLDIAKQTWYGTSADAGGFAGLKSLIAAVNDADTDDGTMVIDANAGGGVSDGSTVFAVRTGLDSIQYAWGSEGKLTEGDIQEQVVGTTSSGAWHYTQQIAGWVGLQVTSRNAAAMITNLSDAGSGAVGLSDNLLYKLLGKFPASEGPDAIFMSRRSLEQLRKSRTATNATGAPAPIPTEIEGVRIIATDAIVNNETGGSGS